MALQCLDAVHTETVSGLSALVRRGDVLVRLGRFEEALANTETVAFDRQDEPFKSAEGVSR